MRMVAGLNFAPTGYCIQPLAIRIHSAEKLVPSASSQVTARWPTLRQAVPAEEEEPDEGRLQEEGHQPLDGQRRAEDVADVMGVVGPVRAELELHGDAGGHAHGEIDAEQQAPEFGHVAPDRPAGHDVDALHDGEQHREAEGQRHEQEVIHRRQRELQARQLHGDGADHFWLPICWIWSATAAAVMAGRSAGAKNKA